MTTDSGDRFSRDLSTRLRRATVRTGLSVPQMARLLATGVSSVEAWSEGTSVPAGPPVLRITELLEILDRLDPVVGPKDIKSWLYTANDQLDGATPAEMIERGNGWAVAALISRMDKLTA